MSTGATEGLREAQRPKNKGARPACALERSTIRVLEEADVVGCCENLRHAMIAAAAYYLAERRGFQPGHELEDWLAAEDKIQRLWTREREGWPISCLPLSPG